MDRLIYTAMTGANAAAHRQTVLSNNLANVSTNGFRAELSAYRAVPLRGDGATTRVFALEATSGHSDQPGPSQTTGRALDVRATGNAWFAVQGLDGTEAYTRAGSMQIGPNGTLQTNNGLTVLSDGSAPLVAPAGAEITIAPNGDISAKTTGQPSIVVGRLKLATPTARRSAASAATTGCFAPPPPTRFPPTRWRACKAARSRARTSTRSRPWSA